MRPTDIFDVLDLARRARKLGKAFNPMFVSPPGLGKSEIVQAWCEKQGIPFEDVRLAYMEAPDFVGYPHVMTKNGREVTTFATPDRWPESGEGVLFFDELNRGNQSTMNALMQLCTDRRIDKYKLPEGWIIVSAVNPEADGKNDVNSMDSALRDRFEMFEVNYDKATFLKFMKESDWDKSLISFVETGTWSYVEPSDVKDVPGAKYISPRTLSKVNTALKAGLPTTDLELLVFEAELGKLYGREFMKFRHDDTPVTFAELVKSEKKALKRLAEHCDVSNTKSGYVSHTLSDLVDSHAQVSEELIAKVLMIVPVDAGTGFLQEFELAKDDAQVKNRIFKANPDLLKRYKEVILSKKSDT